MVFEKYINFSKIFENTQEDCSEYFINLNPSIKSYVDDEINDLRKSTDFLKLHSYAKNSYFKMLQEASTYDYIKSDEIIDININNNNDFVINFICYKSTNSNYHLFYLNIEYEVELFGLVDESINKYFFIGIQFNHPMLLTSDFEFYQSDGSTEFETEYLNNNNKYSVSTLFILMMRHLMEFSYIIYPDV